MKTLFWESVFEKNIYFCHFWSKALIFVRNKQSIILFWKTKLWMFLNTFLFPKRSKTSNIDRDMVLWTYIRSKNLVICFKNVLKTQFFFSFHELFFLFVFWIKKIFDSRVLGFRSWIKFLSDRVRVESWTQPTLRKLGSATVFSETNFACGRLTLQNKQKLLGSTTAFSCDKIKN